MHEQGKAGEIVGGARRGEAELRRVRACDDPPRALDPVRLRGCHGVLRLGLPRGELLDVLQTSACALLAPRRAVEGGGAAAEVLCGRERAPPRACGRAAEDPREDDHERVPDARGGPGGVEPPQELARTRTRPRSGSGAFWRTSSAISTTRSGATSMG